MNTPKTRLHSNKNLSREYYFDYNFELSSGKKKKLDSKAFQYSLFVVDGKINEQKTPKICRTIFSIVSGRIRQASHLNDQQDQLMKCISRIEFDSLLFSCKFIFIKNRNRFNKILNIEKITQLVLDKYNETIKLKNYLLHYTNFFISDLDKNSMRSYLIELVQRVEKHQFLIEEFEQLLSGDKKMKKTAYDSESGPE